MPRILSIETSAPGGWPVRRMRSRKRRLVISSAIEFHFDAGQAVANHLTSLNFDEARFLQLAQLALRLADAPGIHPLVAEQVLGDGPALAFLVHQVVGGHLHVVEEHFVHGMAAVHQDQRAHRDARALHVDQQERDAFLALLHRRVGAHQAEDPVGVVRVGGPDLLAVDDVLVAIPLGLGLERGQVASRARLGVALAPEVVAVVDARQEALLLRLGAEMRAAPARTSTGRRASAAGQPA